MYLNLWEIITGVFLFCENAFIIDIKYSSVYSAHTKILFYHIIKKNNIE